MVKKGLKVHNVRSVLTRVVGAKRSTQLTELSKRSATQFVYKPGSADLPLSAHQHISEKLKKFIENIEDAPVSAHGNATSASSSSEGRMYTPGPLDLGPVSESEVPMPSFLSRGKPFSKQPEQIGTMAVPSDAVDASSSSAVAFHSRRARETDLIEGQSSNTGTSSPDASTTSEVHARLSL